MQSSRSIAQAALAQYDLPAPQLRLLHDGYNVTYEVRDARNRRYALRITRPSVSVVRVRSEVAWCDALTRDSPVRTLSILRSKIGEGYVCSSSRACVLSHWVPGRQFSKFLSTNMVKAVGRTMAHLHRHGRQWTPPNDWARDRLNVTWLHGAPNPIPDLPTEFRSVFGEAHDKLGPILNTLCSERSHVLHADLHQGNYRFAPGCDVGVIDFDDAAVGHPAQDIAISMYYFKKFPNQVELRSAFRAGYEELELWPLDPPTLEALLVWRALGLCASVMVHENANLRNHGVSLLSEWATNCERWLKT